MATPIKAEEGAFITLGLPQKNGPMHMKRAVELLKRHGYAAGITSEEAVLAAARQIEADQLQEPKGAA